MRLILNVLVVDDSEFRVSLVATLIDQGHRVWIARNGTEAMDMAKTFPKGFDLVICAMYFAPCPNPTSGLDVLDYYKTEWPDTKFVLMDGHSPSLTRSFAEKEGANGFLEKQGEWSPDCSRRLRKLLGSLFPERGMPILPQKEEVHG